MGRFFLGDETFRVTFPDEEWVDIKEEFSQADLDYITTKMMQPKFSVNGKAQADIDLSFGKQATLERAIVGWSFKEDDKPVPVTPENVSNLRNRYRTRLLTEIDRLNAEAANFAKN